MLWAGKLRCVQMEMLRPPIDGRSADLILLELATKRNVCGHPKLVHGGISALIIDNVAGYAIFKLKAAGAVPAGPAFTVNLNVNYRKPIPSMSAVICSVKLQSHERKKSLLEIKLYSPPDEQGDNLTYCEATALMVTPSAGQTTGA
mmetsp:Transcript_8310/g.51781  ORF Transcript_8310/g.51781 Transcript_8310/m.51781 type:complete len:146 (+) Transcript_8310:401-838(+)